MRRRLNQAGIVVAPTLVPQKSGLRTRNDRHDSKKLSHNLRSGDLTQVWVPIEQMEALRDLEQAGDGVKNAERTSQHQLSIFLLRNDRTFRDG